MLFFHQYPINAEARPSKVSVSCSISAVATTIPKEIPIAIQLVCSATEPVSVDFGENDIGNIRFFLTAPGSTAEQKRLKVPWLTYPGMVKITPDEPYRTRINLGSIEPSPIPESVSLSAVVVAPASESPIIKTNSVFVTVKEGQSDMVAEQCFALARSIQKSSSAEERLELVSELAFVHDPVALPAFALILGKGFGVDTFLIDALRAVGNKDATDMLLAFARHADPDDARYAVSSAREIERSALHADPKK